MSHSEGTIEASRTESKVPAQRKRILYVGGSPKLLRRLTHGMDHCISLERDSGGAPNGQRVSCEWIASHDLGAALSSLRTTYVNLLLIDLRGAYSFDARVNEMRTLLETLDHAEDLEQRYAFHRILVLLPGVDVEGQRIDDLLIELGALGVRRALREPAEAGEEFDLRVAHSVLQVMRDRKAGKTAICAAGGGITGIYFELASLKCLDDCLVGRGVNDFDLYFGISAGAVVTALVSVGYTVEEIMASIAGVPGGRVPPLTLSLLRLGHFNYDDFKWRAMTALQGAGQALWKALRTRATPDTDALFLEYTSLVGPPFRSDQFERMIRELLEVPGGTNDFRSLPRKLYVGASDQDTRRHVLFGAEGRDHIPISRAVQASVSINPAFSSVPIEGRFYEDGAVTRTSNMVEAINRDATLIFVVDPFVPYISEIAGIARRRGVLYNVDQDIRTITYTRFERTRNLVLRKHPEVSSYTVLPSNTTRKLLSTNPMDHRSYLDIWKGAYLSTLGRIDVLCHRLRGDLADRGIRLDTSRAEVIAQQLSATNSPSFDDFFLDRKVDIRTHPMCNAHRAPRRGEVRVA